MKLFLIEQRVSGYGDYEGAVVAAETADVARLIHPNGDQFGSGIGWTSNPADVSVKYIGEASSELEQGVILASFVGD